MSSGIIGTSSSKSKVIGLPRDTATAWCSFNCDTDAVRDGYNVSSMTDVGLGNQDITFSTPMMHTDYCVSMTPGSFEAGYEITSTSGARSTTQVTMWTRFQTWQGSSGNNSGDFYDVQIFGGK